MLPLERLQVSQYRWQSASELVYLEQRESFETLPLVELLRGACGLDERRRAQRSAQVREGRRMPS